MTSGQCKMRQTYTGEAAAVILAAGYSSRMKAFKPLLDVGGMTAVERLTSTLRAAGINRIAVVTGYCREKLQPVLKKLALQEICNMDYDRGMFSSIKAGLAQASKLWPDAPEFFLMPVDCPLIGEKTIKSLMKAVEADRFNHISNKLYVPVYEGKKGHPLVVPATMTEEICTYDGPGGLKAVTDKHMKRMNRVLVGDEGCLLDMDTPKGYEEVKEFLASGGKTTELKNLASGRTFFLLRHGETEQHRERMFIGRYDVPLSSRGKDDARKAAVAIREEMDALPKAAKAPVIYCSPLLRTVETAEIIAEELELEICPMPEFVEIALGLWDGRPVREIQEEHPELYKARGEDIFSFKTGNGSENFFDMQYRVIKGLKKLLMEDDTTVLIIVAHRGVIRAIENNLCGLRVNDPWEPLAKGCFRKKSLKSAL